MKTSTPQGFCDQCRLNAPAMWVEYGIDNNSARVRILSHGGCSGGQLVPPHPDDEPPIKRHHVFGGEGSKS